MTRAKIQFSPDVDSDRLWKLVEYIRDSYFKSEKREFDKKIQTLKNEFPNATVSGDVKPMSAGEVVMLLIEQEAYKIGYSDD